MRKTQYQMAEMKKVESSPISGDDDLEGTFSVPEFISSMPSYISWLDNASIHHLKLFWTQDDHAHQSMEKIKSAIKGLGIFLYPTLFQIWVPKDVSGQQVLVSADQPFGISSLRKGLCLFRKKCLDYKYSLDGEEDVGGPVGRVFRNGFPEFSPIVRCYSSQEFELRDHAESCGVHGYLVLPVFEGEARECVCVIELITVFDGNYCLTRTVDSVSQALKTVGLRTCNTNWPIDMERSSQHDSALSEIERDLKVVCQEHKIPFAQTWFASKEEGSTETVMRTSGKGSSMLKKSFSSFQNDCIMFGLKNGQSIVWRAFTSSNSCFCKDVSQLSIKDYSLVLSARKANLSAAFAVYLKSSCTEDDDSYVLEFFLPLNHTAYGKPSAYFMNLVLTTVSQHFKSFKIAIKQQGIDGTIYSINGITDCEEKEKTTEPASDDMVLDVPPASPVVQAMQRPSDESPIIVKAVYKDDIIKFQLPLHSGMMNLKDEIILRLKFDEDGFKIKYWVENDKWIQVDSDADLHKCIDVAKSLPNRTLRLVLETVTMITIEVTYKVYIIKFQLPLHSRLVELKGEIILLLKLDEDSFKIMYRAENDEWIQVNSDADLHKCMDEVISIENQTLKLVLEAVTKITVTVTYEKDIIMFQLYPSAGMVDLKNEVTKRFNISCESFRVKYEAGDADGGWRYLCDDEKLHKYLRDMTSNKSTIKFHIERINN